jgi:hypothetical protein
MSILRFPYINVAINNYSRLPRQGRVTPYMQAGYYPYHISKACSTFTPTTIYIQSEAVKDQGILFKIQVLILFRTITDYINIRNPNNKGGFQCLSN